MFLRRALLGGLAVALVVLTAGCGPDAPADRDLSDFAVGPAGAVTG